MITTHLKEIDGWVLLDGDLPGVTRGHETKLDYRHNLRRRSATVVFHAEHCADKDADLTLVRNFLGSVLSSKTWKYGYT